ncbi:MAG: acyltransferase family protein [Bacteroidales bacterium]|nr:acyltransferase family protein [Bacteroidales bacterium]
MKQSRRLNIVKALCIILMVMGHCEPPVGVVGFIYLFHMPAFFFLSGYLLKEEWLDRPGAFVKKRLCTLYVPFVFWELVFLVLNGVFFRLHLVDTQLSGREMLSQAFQFVTFRGHQPLLNGYWFLKTLFFCSIGCLFLLKWIRHGRPWLIAALVAAAGLCRLLPYETTMISRLLMACAFYISGFLAARRQLEIRFPYALAALAAVAVISLFWRQSIFVEGWEVVPYYFVALLGTGGIFGLATALDRLQGTAALLERVGRATLTLLTFHFLSFKLVSLLKIAIWHLPIECLAEFPVIHAHNALFWLVYSLVGVAVPLLVYRLYKRCSHPSGSRSLIKLF